MNGQIRKLGYFLIVLFLLLFGQLNNIQVFQAQALADNPSNNRTVVRDFSGPRGAILTSDGVVLAQSVPSNDQYEWQREYPTGDLFGNVTGFFSFNYGSEGVEKQYNDELAGKDVRLSNIGDLLTDQVTTNDVTLTLSNRLQTEAKNALGNYRGAVVALNPKTGAILAMYSNPSYDPTPLASHDFKSVAEAYPALINAEGNPALPRAYRERYLPGSTFKVVTASAAYDFDPALARKSYPVMRGFPLPNSGGLTLRNFGGGSCGGRLPQLLQVSCNSGFAQMGIDVGAEDMVKQAEQFGFNQVPPLDMPAPAASAFPERDYFLNRNAGLAGLAQNAIGQQNTTATPLQMAMVAAGIGNGGKIMTPHVLKEVRDNQGNVVVPEPSGVWKEATTEDTAKSMTANMVTVARSGTATRASIPGVQVAGKTGTAETSNNRVNAWLISFAPADDPQVAVAVVLENQNGVSEATGGTLAAPIAKQVMQAALQQTPSGNNQ